MPLIDVFTCRYCRKRLYNQGGLEAHEDVCDRNPENGYFASSVQHHNQASRDLPKPQQMQEIPTVALSEKQKSDPLAELHKKVLASIPKPIPPGKLACKKCGIYITPEARLGLCALCRMRQGRRYYERRPGYY